LQDNHNKEFKADPTHDFTECWCCCDTCLSAVPGSLVASLIRAYWQAAHEAGMT
jgi:hypothetical protein